MFKYFFALINLLLFSSQAFAQLEVPPDLKWKRMITPHFEVIYNAEQQDLGLLYASKLETAYTQLRSYFSVAPARTVVVINDKTDVTNGYATRIPYPHIMAYPVLPGPQDSLADSGDWAFELLAHEYTHILTFEPANGIMKPLRSVFGNIIAPNLLLPRWWKEGIAVDMETRLGNHGRLRSIYQDAAIRSWTIDGRLLNFTLAEVNENMPSWPQGLRPYLFGSLMWSQMIQDKGDSVVDSLHQKHSSRVPYFVENPASEIFDKSYMSEYESALTTTYLLAQDQIKVLRAQKPTPYIQPKNKAQVIMAPTISPDGKNLAIITEDDSNSRSVKVITKTNLKQSFLLVQAAVTAEDFNEARVPELQNDSPLTGSIQRISWFPDSTRIIYDKIDMTNRLQRFSDLYIWDFKNKKSSSLTKGLRAREPSVSPNGEDVVFVHLSGGKTSLGILSLAGDAKSSRDVYSPEMQDRISYPSYLNDKTIVFSLRKPDGNEHLHLLHLDSMTVQKILPDFPNSRFARVTSAGLAFTSSKNGTHNIYLANSDLTDAKPLTHTLTACFSFDLDPNTKELFSTIMTSRGQKMVAFDEKSYQATQNPLPQIQPLLAERYPTKEAPTTAATASETEAETESNTLTPEPYQIEDYTAASYLWPQYWMPFIAGSSSETGLIIQAQTSGFDPLKKHVYTLTGSWDTAVNKGSAQGTYLNHTTALPVMLSSYTRSSYLGNTANSFEDFSASLTALPDAFWLSKYANIQTGWQYFQRSTDTSKIKRTGPQATLIYANYTQSGDEVSPESGWGGYLGAHHYVPAEDYVAHNQFNLGGTVYLSQFLKARHVLMIKVNSIYTPEKIPALFGVTSTPLVFVPDNPLPEFIMRGYRTGQFLGKNVINTNIEYRFPIQNIYGGYGTDPYFIRRLTGALIADGIAADGFFANDEKAVYEIINTKRHFWAVGAEVKLEMTLGYTFPVTVVMGYYAALDAPSGTEGALAMTLQLGGF